MSLKFTVGADPEYFLKKNGVNVSAHGLVKGTKKKPMLLEGGAVQVDGTALEFNIDPAENEEQFLQHIDMVLAQIRDLIPEEYEFVFDPVAEYDPNYFKNLPFAARELGCDPDYNAYSGLRNPVPDNEETFRTSSGHIHLGFERAEDDADHFLDCQAIIKACDYFIGLPLTLIEPISKRQKLYGKAGAFRPKPYGVEYRSPSSFWVKSPTLQRFVFQQVKRMENFFNFPESTPEELYFGQNTNGKRWHDRYGPHHNPQRHKDLEYEWGTIKVPTDVKGWVRDLLPAYEAEVANAVR